MRAAAMDDNFKIVFARAMAADAGAERATLELRGIVKTVNFVHREALKNAVFNHRARALSGLLARLEHKADGAVEILVFREQLDRAEQRCRVAVVAAAVHQAVVFRAIGKCILLL